VPDHHAQGVKQGTVVVEVRGVIGAFNHLAKVPDAFSNLVQRVNFEMFLEKKKYYFLVMRLFAAFEVYAANNIMLLRGACIHLPDRMIINLRTKT